MLQILTLFESVVKRAFLASNFTTTGELLGTCNQSGPASHDYSDPRSVAVLPWVPHTIAAVALRLFELDASIIYIPHEKPGPADEGKDDRLYTVSFLLVSHSLSHMHAHIYKLLYTCACLHTKENILVSP